MNKDRSVKLRDVVTLLRQANDLLRDIVDGERADFLVLTEEERLSPRGTLIDSGARILDNAKNRIEISHLTACLLSTYCDDDWK